MEPLQWNTLNEAANWLSEATSEEWTAKHVLSASLVHLRQMRPFPKTYLKAAMPRGTQFAVYEWNTDKGTLSNPFVRKFDTSWRAIPLHMKNIVELLIHDETSSSLVQSPDDDEGMENEYIFIEPLDQEHIVTLPMIGVNAEDLKSLLEKFLGMGKFTQQPSHAADGQAKYSTKTLELLGKAVSEFWENHNPETPPKKDIVVDWFKKRGVSEKIASSLDTAMRSEKALKGGNKTVRKSTK